MLSRREYDLESYPDPNQMPIDTEMPHMSFTDTLGKSEWESIATYCVLKAQKAGHWIAIKLSGGTIFLERSDV